MDMIRKKLNKFYFIYYVKAYYYISNMSTKTKRNSNNKKSFKKKTTPKRNFKKKDKKFFDELNKASDIFFNECIVSQDLADDIKTRVYYELSYEGHNLWFNIGNNKEKDKIFVDEKSNYEFLRSKLFKNYNFQKRVYDYYLENIPEIETIFVGPIKRSGDLLIKLVPYHKD